MARVSRKKKNMQDNLADASARIWKTALYVRLSVEDNGTDSDSIENQTALLGEYVANHHDLKKTFARETVELAVMGVHKEDHRKGWVGNFL